jgi:hypothetical protein
MDIQVAIASPAGLVARTACSNTSRPAEVGVAKPRLDDAGLLEGAADDGDAATKRSGTVRATSMCQCQASTTHFGQEVVCGLRGVTNSVSAPVIQMPITDYE